MLAMLLAWTALAISRGAPAPKPGEEPGPAKPQFVQVNCVIREVGRDAQKMLARPQVKMAIHEQAAGKVGQT
jgi:hypothetical protein